MTIWTLDQVAAMKGYRFSQAVDMFQLARAEKADGSNPMREYVIERLFQSLQEAGHTWGVEIDRGDCQVKVDPAEEGHYLEKVRIRWAPQTDAVVLIGGPKGGTTMQLAPDVLRGGRLQVQILRAAAPLFSSEPDAERVAVDAGSYDYAGWSEARRLWAWRWNRVAD